jgi:hypothetical protein
VFRLDKEFGEQRARLTVSGEISSACVEVLETCCEQTIKDGKAVDLVLDVTTIDESGHALLRRLVAKGVRIFAKGIYHSYLVDTICRAVSSDPTRRCERSNGASRIWNVACLCPDERKEFDE